MSDPKRHHVLPQTYLEGFSVENGLVPCFNKSSGKSFKTSQLNAGVRKDFNTVVFSDGTKDRRTIEDFYGLVETDFPATIDDVKSPPVSPETCDFFIQFAIRQKMRTPRAKKELGILIKQLQDHGLLDGFEGSFSDEENGLLGAAKNGDLAALDQIGLRISGHYGMAIAAQTETMGFVFLPSSCSKHLITCDDPVMIFGLSYSGAKTTLTAPLPALRKVLVFPLNAETLMYGDTNLKDPSGVISYHRSASVDVGIVRRVNQLLAINAQEQLIADVHRNRELSQRVLKTQLTEVRSGRIEISEYFSNTFIQVVDRIERQLSPPNYFRTD